jgi:hypothetical protein
MYNKQQVLASKHQDGRKDVKQLQENEYFSSGDSGCENSSLQKVRTRNLYFPNQQH